ncbi:MAG: discoidin domain-containing protein, partial [Planctomycetota bacterium]
MRGTEKTRSMWQTLPRIDGTGLRLTALLVACALVLAAADPAGAERLDRLDLGNSESERAHNLEAQGSEVVDYSALPKPEVRITELTASADEVGAFKSIDGDEASRWGTVAEEAWVQYTLSKTIELDEVKIKSRDPYHKNPVEIRVSTDGENWRTVASGKTTEEKGGSGEGPGTAIWQSFNFDTTRARHVRVVMSEGTYRGAHGRQLWLWEVRLGDLQWPEAYVGVTGHRALGEVGRRLFSRVNTTEELKGDEWMDGWMAFDMDIDPQKHNYITIKVWGSEVSSADLALMLPHRSEDEPYRWITTGGRFE